MFCRAWVCCARRIALKMQAFPNLCSEIRLKETYQHAQVLRPRGTGSRQAGAVSTTVNLSAITAPANQYLSLTACTNVHPVCLEIINHTPSALWYSQTFIPVVPRAMSATRLNV